MPLAPIVPLFGGIDGNFEFFLLCVFEGVPSAPWVSAINDNQPSGMIDHPFVELLKSRHEV